MADRGMGIRLFHSKDSLQQIFEEFEEEEDEDNPSDTAVVTSQLRHFVIQVRHGCLAPIQNLRAADFKSFRDTF